MTTKLATSGSNNNHNNNNNNVQEDESSACATALLRSLHFSGVRFLRYFTVDAFNNVRCKAKPVENLLSQKHGLEDGVSIAEICYAGLPRYADMAVSQTGLTAAKSLVVRPDLSTLRILPYAPSSAMVLGWSVDPFANNDDSPYCTRSLLRRVVRAAKRDHNVAFVSVIRLVLAYAMCRCSSVLFRKNWFPNQTPVTRFTKLSQSLLSCDGGY